MESVIGSLGPQYIDYSTATQVIGAGLDLPDRISATNEALRLDLKDANVIDKAKASLILGAFLMEQGPLNELIAAWPTIAVLNSTGSPIMAGLTGGLTYATQQGIYGLATAKGITSLPETEKSIHMHFNTTREGGARKIDRLFLLLGLGASAAIMHEHARNENQTFKKDVRLLGKITVFLGVVDVAIFSSISQFINKPPEAVGLDSSELIDLASNPLTYIAAFGIYKFAEMYNKYRKNLKN